MVKSSSHNIGTNQIWTLFLPEESQGLLLKRKINKSPTPKLTMLPKSLSKMYILKLQLSPKFEVEEMPFKQGVKLEKQFDKVSLKGFNCDCPL